MTGGMCAKIVQCLYSAEIWQHFVSQILLNICGTEYCTTFCSAKIVHCYIVQRLGSTLRDKYFATFCGKKNVQQFEIQFCTTYCDIKIVQQFVILRLCNILCYKDCAKRRPIFHILNNARIDIFTRAFNILSFI